MGLRVLPPEVQRDWNANLEVAEPTDKGKWSLVEARPGNGTAEESQRIVVRLIDENGYNYDGVVAFAFTTGEKQIIVTNDWLWNPPAQPNKAQLVTSRGGYAEQVQGGAVKKGQPGGVTVYVYDPELASDVVRGAGMLADHTGLVLTFKRIPAGKQTIDERLAALEARVAALEG
jgi:hypothetical protein